MQNIAAFNWLPCAGARFASLWSMAAKPTEGLYNQRYEVFAKWKNLL